MVEFIPINIKDATQVINNVWERGVDEALVFGVQEDEILTYIKNHLNDPYGYIAKADGVPFAVFGAYNTTPTVCRTWFMATDDFSKHFMALTRKIKKVMEQNAKRDGVRVIETLSACRHPMASKWFKVLGLEVEGCYAFGTGVMRYIKKVN